MGAVCRHQPDSIDSACLRLRLSWRSPSTYTLSVRHAACARTRTRSRVRGTAPYRLPWRTATGGAAAPHAAGRARRVAARRRPRRSGRRGVSARARRAGRRRAYLFRNSYVIVNVGSSDATLAPHKTDNMNDSLYRETHEHDPGIEVESKRREKSVNTQPPPT